MSESKSNMPASQNREEALFQAASQLTGPERVTFLNGACLGDDALHQRLKALLAAHDAPDELSPETAPVAVATMKIEFADLPDEAVGQTLGRYKLMERLGEGGCGVVYVAEQTEPVRRRVALKVIKLGMDTKQVVARFEAERQALAMMDHPNIAKVLDAGTTETGRPFFVMELVRGIRITDYCDQTNLSTQERLDLFIKVCQAIQHAHQKGIIHRDIKPSNILVTLHDGVPVPKVIDFGIAKATEGRLTDNTVYTQLHQFIGTPAYMSPEQAEMSGLDIDTRSDIYSLGVLLYELLAGSPPFDPQDLMSRGIDAMRKTIREVEPPRPSTRVATLGADELTTTAKRRSAETSKLLHQLKGDLDWIVMKCLEKDRTRRYETANGLAFDIKRHLNNEPVLACPPSKFYEFQKTVRRHKFGFAATTAIIIALSVGVAASVWQAKRAQHEAARAKSAEQRAVAAFDELRATAPAFAEQARSLAAKEQYSDAIAKLDYAIKLRPDAAEYLVAKGDLLQCQLQLAPAAAIYREALRLQPGLARAEASAKLCDELLAAKPNADGKLTRESLAKLNLAMQQQQRPAAELLPVARLLGEEKKLLLDYWLARLKDLPVSPENPLAKRLTIRENGRLALDLSDTKVTDLTPLAGAPLAALDVSKSQELTDISALRGLDLVELNLSGTGVADLAPLRDMHTLEKLNVAGSKVADLAALRALRLKSLNFVGCPISDLRAIQKMPLEDVNLRETRVTDLSPLIGMPIKSIDLSMAPVLDFSPLARLPLERCILQRNRITDLAVLRGKPLKELVLWGCLEARHYAVLAEIKTLELLLLDSSYRTLPDEDYAAIGSLRAHPRLRQIGSEIMSQMGYAAIGSKDIFWQDWDREQGFITQLRKSGIQFSLQKLPTETYKLGFSHQPLRDLSILEGVPITELILDTCAVSDLTPIHNLRLERLTIFSERIADLSPLRGMPLKTLSLWDSKITDLSPLQGLPLRELYLENCGNVTNVAALAEIPTLEKLTVPMQAVNIETLHHLANLQMLAFNRNRNGTPASPAAEFWKDYRWTSRLRDSGLKPKTLKQFDDGTWEVNLDGSGVGDLAILRGVAISKLDLGETAVADLSPLRDMPLKRLMLWRTKVTDLSPLKGMPLEELILNETETADLSPLAGMKLHMLHLALTKVADLSVLRGMPLTSLRLDDCPAGIDLSPLAENKTLIYLTLPPGAKNIVRLRALPKLERISFTEGTDYDPDKTTAEFWAEYDAKTAEGKQP